MFILALSVCVILHAASAFESPPDRNAQPVPRIVAATVDGRDVFVNEVERVVLAATRGRPIADGARAWLRAEALRQLVDRKAIEAHFVRSGQSAGERAVKAAIDALEAEAERRQVAIESLLAPQGLEKATLEGELSWRLSWKKYLDKHATDESLERHFKERSREFDGTQLRVRQILIRPDAAAAGAPLDAAIEHAVELRRRIAAGELEFAAAAMEFSDAPSGRDGGDLGFIARRGSMVEPFARAAFALKRDELSEPVVTQFGVHLIQVTEIRPGEKALPDVRDEVRESLARELFSTLAEAERDNSKVVYSGLAPYFDLESGKLIEPDGADR